MWENDYDVNSYYPQTVINFTVVTKLEKISIDAKTGWSVYSALLGEVSDWIESQSFKQWKHGDDTQSGYACLYEISPELEPWLVLRWS